jgi:hypothetical protein
LAAAIEEASRRGEIRPVPAEKTAWLVADMIRGTIQRRLLSRSESPVSADAAFLTDFVWTALTQA